MDRRELLLKDIREMAEQYREEIPGGRKAWPKSIKNKVLELYSLGLGPTEVAQETGLAYFTVHNWKRRNPPFKQLVVAAPTVPAVQATCPILTVTVTINGKIRFEGLSFEQAMLAAERFR